MEREQLIYNKKEKKKPEMKHVARLQPLNPHWLKVLAFNFAQEYC